MFQSGSFVGGVTAIILNLIFRLCVSKSARLAISSDPGMPDAGQQIVDFIEEHGATWNARRDAITRAAQAGLEAAAAIAAPGGRGVTEVRGGFRPAEARVGKECVSTCGPRGWPDNYK